MERYELFVLAQELLEFLYEFARNNNLVFYLFQNKPPQPDPTVCQVDGLCLLLSKEGIPSSILTPWGIVSFTNGGFWTAGNLAEKLDTSLGLQNTGVVIHSHSVYRVTRLNGKNIPVSPLYFPDATQKQGETWVEWWTLYARFRIETKNY